MKASRVDADRKDYFEKTQVVKFEMDFLSEITAQKSWGLLDDW